MPRVRLQDCGAWGSGAWDPAGKREEGRVGGRHAGSGCRGLARPFGGGREEGVSHPPRDWPLGFQKERPRPGRLVGSAALQAAPCPPGGMWEMGWVHSSPPCINNKDAQEDQNEHFQSFIAMI